MKSKERIVPSHNRTGKSRRTFLQLLGGMALALSLPSVYGEREPPNYVYTDFLAFLSDKRYNVFPVV
jgi:hypothetical protein